MRNHLTRVIAWLCIIAHLNLIMPSFHEARAMNFEEEGVRTTCSKKFLHEEQDLTLRPSVNSLWNSASFFIYDILPFAVGVMTEDPLSYSLYIAGKNLLEYLQEDRETNVAKKTVDVVKGASRAIASTIPYVAPLLLPVMRAIDINGGAHLNMSYYDYCSGWVLFSNKTAPYPIDIDPNVTIQTIFEHGLYDPNKPYPVGSSYWETYYVTFRAQVSEFRFFNPGTMNASIYNLTRIGEAFPTTLVSISSTPETIQKFLSHLQVSFFSCNTALTNFKYFTMDNESLINASRIYYSPNPTNAPTNAPVDPIPYIVMGTFAGLVLVGTVGVGIYSMFCRRSAEYITVNVGSEDQRPTPQGKNYQS